MSFKRNTRITGLTIGKMSIWNATQEEVVEPPPPPTVLSPKEFDNATNWVPTNIAADPNVTTDPILHMLTADFLKSTSIGSKIRHLIQGGLSFEAGYLYTFSVYAKNNNLPAGQHLSLTFGTTCFDQDWATFDVPNGDLVEEFGGSSTGRQSSVLDMGGGWFKYSFSLVAKATGTDDIGIGFTNTSTYRSYSTMSSGQGVYLWNAQISIT